MSSDGRRIYTSLWIVESRSNLISGIFWQPEILHRFFFGRWFGQDWCRTVTCLDKVSHMVQLFSMAATRATLLMALLQPTANSKWYPPGSKTRATSEKKWSLLKWQDPIPELAYCRDLFPEYACAILWLLSTCGCRSFDWNDAKNTKIPLWPELFQHFTMLWICKTENSLKVQCLQPTFLTKGCPLQQPATNLYKMRFIQCHRSGSTWPHWHCLKFIMPSHGYDSSSAVPVAGELPSDENIGDELHKLWDTMNFDVKARCEVCFALESMASTLNHSLVLRRISMGSLGSFMNKKRPMWGCWTRLCDDNFFRGVFMIPDARIPSVSVEPDTTSKTPTTGAEFRDLEAGCSTGGNVGNLNIYKSNVYKLQMYFSFGMIWMPQNGRTG